MKHPSRMTEAELRERIAEVERKIALYRSCRYHASADAQEFARARVAFWLERISAQAAEAQCLAARSVR